MTQHRSYARPDPGRGGSTLSTDPTLDALPAARPLAGVRLFGQRQIVFAWSEGVNVRLRQVVAVEIAGAIEAGVVVITPDQLQEYQLSDPVARVLRVLTGDEARAAGAQHGPRREDGQRLLESLNLPSDTLHLMGVLDEGVGGPNEVED